MSKHSQGSFPRLAVVSPQGEKNDVKPGVVRCFSEMEWGLTTARVTVMPKLAMRWPLSWLSALWKGVRRCLSAQPAHSRHGTVLSFRRHGLGAPALSGFSTFAAESLTAKKASGSVPWQVEHTTASKEEGQR